MLEKEEQSISSLLNVEDDGYADLVKIEGIKMLVMRDENEREITREEVERALNETKAVKAAGLDDEKDEILKIGSETVLV